MHALLTPLHPASPAHAVDHLGGPTRSATHTTGAAIARIPSSGAVAEHARIPAGSTRAATAASTADARETQTTSATRPGTTTAAGAASAAIATSSADTAGAADAARAAG